MPVVTEVNEPLIRDFMTRAVTNVFKTMTGREPRVSARFCRHGGSSWEADPNCCSSPNGGYGRVYRCVQRSYLSAPRCNLTIPSILRGTHFSIEPISSVVHHSYYFECGARRLVADILIKQAD